MKVKNNSHQAFIAAVRETCAARNVPYTLRRTKSGYILRVGEASLTWHRSQSPWHIKNIRRLGLESDIAPRHP